MRHCLLAVLTGSFLFLLLPALSFAAPAAQAVPSAGVLLEITTGKATYYSDKFHKRKTANGERYDKTAFTAAHRTLPMGTVVRVTNLHNGRSALVRINDRGPAKRAWLIDLSKAAAARLDMMRRGVARVQVEVVSDNKGLCLREHGFFVNVRSVSSEEEGARQIRRLATAPAGKPAAQTSSRANRSARPGSAGRVPVEAKVFTSRDGVSGQSRCFLGLGPFSSFREAEKARRRISPARGKAGPETEAVLLCLPLRSVASSPAVAAGPR